MIRSIKETLKKVPGIPMLYYYYRYVGAMLRLGRLTDQMEAIFTDIRRRNAFGGRESVSGPGSSQDQTRQIVQALPVIFRELGVSKVLDIPCGDFHWMRKVDLHEIRYIGGDVVKELIDQNRKYEKGNISFQQLNLITSKLPMVDIILCRDCLVHFSFDDALSALRNICASDATYLLTTTFTERTKNNDIFTGSWRPLNLEAPPFNLGKPVRVINEGCTDGDGHWRDKALGLWRIEEIRDRFSMSVKLRR